MLTQYMTLCVHLILLLSLRRKVVNDAKKLRDLFTASRSARCFCRFPVPVILFNKKVLTDTSSGNLHS